jgi:hypothetical protein
MEREKLKLIVRNLELLVDSLKAEVYSDPDAYKTSVNTSRFPDISGNSLFETDYDEIFEDDDD